MSSPLSARFHDAPAGPVLEAESEAARQEARRWLSALGAKWSFAILDCLAERPHRYNALLDALNVAPKVLTQTLRRLEAEGLVARESVQRGGRRYRLTPLGRRLHQLSVPVRRIAATRQLAAALDDSPGAESDTAGDTVFTVAVARRH